MMVVAEIKTQPPNRVNEADTFKTQDVATILHTSIV